MKYLETARQAVVKHEAAVEKDGPRRVLAMMAGLDESMADGLIGAVLKTLAEWDPEVLEVTKVQVPPSETPAPPCTDQPTPASCESHSIRAGSAHDTCAVPGRRDASSPGSAAPVPEIAEPACDAPRIVTTAPTRWTGAGDLPPGTPGLLVRGPHIARPLRSCLQRRARRGERGAIVWLAGRQRYLRRDQFERV